MSELEQLADAIEAAAFEDMFAAVPAPLAATLGTRVEHRGGAAVFVAPPLPAALFNRVIGLGGAQPASEALLDAIVELYRRAGASRFWVHVGPAARPAELIGWLGARHFALASRRSWAKVLRGTEAPPDVSTPFKVSRLEPGKEAEFAMVLAAAHGMPPVLLPWVEALARRPHWQAYAATDSQGAIIAGGCSFIHADSAWLGLGGTLPDHRGRGAQSALLGLRIRDAIAFGARRVASETGEPMTTEANPSLANLYKMGFERVASRANYELVL